MPVRRTAAYRNVLEVFLGIGFASLPVKHQVGAGTEPSVQNHVQGEIL
jgi:hypothetical protein